MKFYEYFKLARYFITWKQHNLNFSCEPLLLLAFISEKSYTLLMHRLKRCSSQCPFIYFDWLLEIDELSNMYLTLLQKQSFRKINIKVQNPSKLVQSGFMMQIKYTKYFSQNIWCCNWFICLCVNCSEIMKINTFDHRFQGFYWECMKSIRPCFK